MKILKHPDPPELWSINETCVVCTAELELEETDLFQVNPNYPAFHRLHSPAPAAAFCCPICENVQIISVPYPQPEVLMEYDDWFSKTQSADRLPDVLYRSKNNEFHVIHLGEEGVNMFYLDSTGFREVLRPMIPSVKTMQVRFPAERLLEKYHETKALLDKHADRVFDDPEYPLNGLRYLYSAPEANVVQEMLEERLRQKMALAFDPKVA